MYLLTWILIGLIGMPAWGLMSASAPNTQVQLPQDYPIAAVQFGDVQIRDRFWQQRLQVNKDVTLPHVLDQCHKTGRIGNFQRAAGISSGPFEGAHFNDSDVYKIMEGAAYCLQGGTERMLGLYLDNLIRIIAAAQWEDGYLFTFYSVPQRRPQLRWSNIQWNHELYCMGHMYEAAAAYYQATGSKVLLDVAVRNADLVCRTFNPDGRTDPPGHQEIEIGLCRLYRVTGERRYLDQAIFLLDQRGRTGGRGPDGKGGSYGTYAQDHLPVLQQTEAVGHAVRAMYMYSAMADVAALSGNGDYAETLDRIWADVVGRKLYVTGGIGAAGGHEGFAGPYELPNLTAYCETCASIANIFWNHRMFLLHGDARYIDVLERTLYNALLSGVSMQGDRFFYPNPLQSLGQYQRSGWFDCACCPSNIVRFIPTVPGLAYGYSEGHIYVNLFIAGKASVKTTAGPVEITQQTDYPWDGKVSIQLQPKEKTRLTLHIRIPGWARGEPVPSDLYRFADRTTDSPTLQINGRPVELAIEKGYAVVERDWGVGDTIDLDLPMPVRRLVAHQNVKADLGRVALQRGPIVFCLEGPDNGGNVLDLYIPDDAGLTAHFRPELLGGLVTIEGIGRTTRRNIDGQIVPLGDRPFVAIPYYAWAHRGPAQMVVWAARVPEATRPRPADTLTTKARLRASFVHVSLEAIRDQMTPDSSSDTSNLQLDFWPHQGTSEWVQFEWDRRQTVSLVKVYWFDDTGTGACRLPIGWSILYRDEHGQFTAVENTCPYTVEKDRFNLVTFKPVQTDCIRIQLQLQKDWSAGILEAVIE